MALHSYCDGSVVIGEESSLCALNKPNDNVGGPVITTRSLVLQNVTTSLTPLLFLTLVFITGLLWFVKRKGVIFPSTVAGQTVLGYSKGLQSRLVKASSRLTSASLRKKKKAITIIVEKPIALRIAQFMVDTDFLNLKASGLRAINVSRWEQLLFEIATRDPGGMLFAMPVKSVSPGACSTVKPASEEISTSTAVRQKVALSLPQPEAMLSEHAQGEVLDYSTSDASPVASTTHGASWELDKRPSLSSLSSASFPTNANEMKSSEPRRMTWDAQEQSALAASNKAPSSKRRRARKSRQRSKSLTLSNAIQLETSISLWPNPTGNSLSHFMPPPPGLLLPPPGLVLRPPPGLDPPKRTSLRADAQPFIPSRMSDISPAVPFGYPVTPTSRSERSSTLASVRSSRTTSSDGEFFHHHHSDELLQVNRLMRGTPTDDGHDADDEEEISYYEEERPSVDLSFLET